MVIKKGQKKKHKPKNKLKKEKKVDKAVESVASETHEEAVSEVNHELLSKHIKPQFSIITPFNEKTVNQLIKDYYLDFFKFILYAKDISALKLISKKLGELKIQPTLKEILDPARYILQNDSNKEVVAFLNEMKLIRRDTITKIRGEKLVKYGEFISHKELATIVKENRITDQHFIWELYNDCKAHFNLYFCKTFKEDLVIVKAIAKKHEFLSKAVANFIKAILSDSDQEVFYNEAIDFLSRYDENKTDNNFDFLFEEISYSICTHYRSKQTEILDKIFIDKLDARIPNNFSKIANIAFASYKSAQPILALEYIKKIEQHIDVIKKSITLDEEKKIYNIFASIYSHFDGEKSLKYHKLYLDLDNTDKRVIHSKYVAYINFGKPKKAEKELYHDLKKIGLNDDSIKKFKFKMNEKISYGEINSKISLLLRDCLYLEAFEEFNRQKKEVGMSKIILLFNNIINYCAHEAPNECDIILKFYEEQYDEISEFDFKNDPSLKYNEFKLYINNNKEDQALSALEIIKSQIDLGPIIKSKVIDCEKYYIKYLVSNKRYDDAIYFLDNNSINQEHLKNKYKKLIELLKSKEAKNESLAVNQNVVDNKDLPEIEWAESEEEYKCFEKYSHKEIHNYFQFKKQQINKKDVKVHKADVFSWSIEKLGDFNLSMNQIHQVDDKGHFFAVISQSLILDKVAYDQFLNALDNGIADRQNGIKFIGNIIELKINGDLRLWTDKIYKNPNGEYLIIFDHVGNHVKIKNTVDNNKKITIIDVPFIKDSMNDSTSEDDFVLKEPLHFDVKEFQKFLVENQDKIEESVEHIGED